MDDDKLYINNKKSSKSIYKRIDKYISNRYDIVFNEISLDHYIKFKGKKNWTVLNLSSLMIDIDIEGIKIKKSELENYLDSYYIKRINPFKTYFEELEPWDNIDYIKNLTSYVKTDDDKLFEYHLKKWMARTVKCALEEKKVNKQCIVLAQNEQNTGKTTFCRFLCPESLSKHISENIAHDKDGLVDLCKNFLIVLDEIDKISTKAIDAYKSFFSKTNINIRLPYGKKNVMIPRTGSFFGSTNIINFLKDETGSVRWVCFELIGEIDFNYSKNIDINKIWAQAYHLAYKDISFEPELTREDVIINDKRNQRYKAFTIEQDIINELFEKSDNRDEFMTASEVTSIIKKQHGYVNHIMIGKELNRLEFRRVTHSQKSIKGYLIKRRNN